MAMPAEPHGRVDTLGHICGLALGVAPVLAFLAAVLGLDLLIGVAASVLVLAVLVAVVLGALAEDWRGALAKTVRDPFWLIAVGLIVLYLMLSSSISKVLLEAF